MLQRVYSGSSLVLICIVLGWWKFLRRRRVFHDRSFDEVSMMIYAVLIDLPASDSNSENTRIGDEQSITGDGSIEGLG